ncbi:MAG: ROK family protein [Calditrichae bacterium]|nr:ROK family protein [Calditrichota bacterium]MCB9058529.1 ROK family protein [Calditrichia bacterium]
MSSASGYYVGIDIGGTNTEIGLIERDGSVKCLESIKTTGNGFETFFAETCEAITKITNGEKYLGIGIGAPSANPEKGCLDNPINLKWGTVEISKIFNQRFHVPVKLINDANAAALGELRFGRAKDWHSFIHVTLGTGLGSSIIYENKVINGKDGFAGELGHTKISDRHRLCTCGHYGCLETYVSANGIRRTVYELLAARQDESELRSVNYNDLNPKLIAEYAHDGDPIAIKAYNITGQILGDKLADVFALLNPQGVCLSGGMTGAGDVLINPVRDALFSSLLDIHKHDIDLRVSDPDSRIAVLGAASLVMDINQ